MKNLFFASVIALGTLTTVNAQDKEPMAMNNATVETVVNQEFKELKATDLPQAVTDAVVKKFESAVIKKAYANEKGEYKLVLVSTDDSTDEISEENEETVYLNNNGEFIEKQ